MSKSIPLGACLVCMAALMGAGAVSVQAGGASVPVLASQPTEFRAPMSLTANLVEETLSQTLRYTLGSVNGARSAASGLNVPASLLPAIWFSTTKSGGEGDDDKDKGKDGDEDKGKGKGRDKDDEAPAPVPEPSTMLTFGAALAIGGGVFFLGRLRKERK